MADPQNLFAEVPRRAGQMPSLLAEDTSTVLESELTADTSPERYAHSQDIAEDDTIAQYDPYVRITGFGIDYTYCDDVTFSGFASMRQELTREAARYLVHERRWSRESDPRNTVGQKNVIIIFASIATIEECLVDQKSGRLLDVTRPFDALMDPLGMRLQTTGRRRSYQFLETIQKAFVKSRLKEIEGLTGNGNRLAPEPSDLSGLGKMLLDVMDRHIAFLRTKIPLARHDMAMPFEQLLKLRLGQVKYQLRDKESAEMCFKTFVPTIPADQQTSWPRVGMATSWEAARAKMIAEHSEPAVDSGTSKHLDHGLTKALEVSRDAHSSFGVKVPGIPADGPVHSLQSNPNPPAGNHDTGQPDALSGLRMFKTAVCQVHRAIRGSRDSSDFRAFIGQIENDIMQSHAAMQVARALDMVGSPGPTGILGSELDSLLDRRSIRSLMNGGLGLILKEWHEQYFTDELRQKIQAEVIEELHMIGNAANQVCSDEA